MEDTAPTVLETTRATSPPVAARRYFKRMHEPAPSAVRAPLTYPRELHLQAQGGVDPMPTARTPPLSSVFWRWQSHVLTGPVELGATMAGGKSIASLRGVTHQLVHFPLPIEDFRRCGCKLRYVSGPQKENAIVVAPVQSHRLHG